MSVMPNQLDQPVSAPPPATPDDPVSHMISKGWHCVGSVRSSLARWLPPNARLKEHYEHKVKTLMTGEQARLDENRRAREVNPHIPEYEPQYTYQTVYTPATTPLPLDQAVEAQFFKDWEALEGELAKQAG
jgi:hypothetical protein